ncbi:hypothetical protein [uncultured Sphaerochaeta sp.]|uniref:hypothetical protein n=1 Tax=uncultured Sphaerochaeta sp. TaxID=886478 RepID=UPI002A0A45D9|nr:hypothetical protein [uncultured Sphaerochaeta sp.]
MKKKFLITLMVVCVLLPAALSAAVADLSIGATAMYGGGNGQDVFEQIQAGDFSGFSDVSNYTFGVDVRVKLLIAEVDVVGMYNKTEVSGTAYHEFSTLVTGGVSLDLLGIARLGLGIGPRFLITIDENGNTVLFDSNGTPITNNEGFGNALMNSPVAYRATLDFNLGGIMAGLNYTLDSNYTFADGASVGELFNVSPENGKVGVSILFSLL